MDQSDIMKLPYIQSGQAQKHITYNEAIRMLDALSHISVASSGADAPVASPAPGDRHIVGDSPTGDWAGHAQDIAAFQDGVWTFYPPFEGCLAWQSQLEELWVWSAGVWRQANASSQFDLLGVNATANTHDRLTVSSDASLFNHAGTDHRLKINRSAAADTASVLFQTAFTGHAEFGLTGAETFLLKTSPDGNVWTDALSVRLDNGAISAPSGLMAPGLGDNLLINGDFSINQRQFPGGALASEQYGHDRWKAGASGCTYDVSGAQINLSAGILAQIVETPAIAGHFVTISVEDLSGADLTISCNGQTSTLSPAAGRTGASFAIPDAFTGDLEISLAATGASFSRVQATLGQTLHAWSPRHPGLELQLCQRYFEQIGPTSSGYTPICQASSVTSEMISGLLNYSRKRTSPQVSASGVFQCLGVANASKVSTVSVYNPLPNACEIRLNLNSPVSANGLAGLLRSENDMNAFIAIDAEL